jgi:hypothetical protein
MLDQHTAVTQSYAIPGQCWPAELCWLHGAFRKSKAHAEIGVYCGRSLFATCCGLPDGATVHAVDPGPDAPEFPTSFPVPSRTWSDEVLDATLRAIEKSASGLIVTRHPLTSLDAARLLHSQGVRLDSVYIDASHHYAEVMADIGAWRPLVRPGGIIAGHDYWPAHVGVMDAVNEVFGRGFEVVKGTRIWWARVPG